MRASRLCLVFLLQAGLALQGEQVLAQVGGSSFDQEFCTAMTQFADRTNEEIQQRGGIMVDAATRLDGIAVLCSSKYMVMHRFIFAFEAEMREGWLARKQQQWNEIYCSSSTREAIVIYGWTIETSLTLQDGARYYIVADCT